MMQKFLFLFFKMTSHAIRIKSNDIRNFLLYYYVLLLFIFMFNYILFVQITNIFTIFLYKKKLFTKIIVFINSFDLTKHFFLWAVYPHQPPPPRLYREIKIASLIFIKFITSFLLFFASEIILLFLHKYPISFAKKERKKNSTIFKNYKNRSEQVKYENVSLYLSFHIVIFVVLSSNFLRRNKL